MHTRHLLLSIAAFLGIAAWLPLTVAAGAAQSPVKVQLTVEPGHLWTPPFGLGRVGRPMEAVVAVPDGARLPCECVIVEYRDGKEIGRQAVTFIENAQPKAHFGRVALGRWPAEVAVWAKFEPQAALLEVARARVTPPAFEAEALARPDRIINPVDLGTVLVPADWLLLAGGQKAQIEIAALSRGGDVPGCRASAWYQSAPDKKVGVNLPLGRGQRAEAKLAMDAASTTQKQDKLCVAVMDGLGKELWRKEIRVMLVPEPPKWPSFGAVATKLRYDLPIPAAGGKMIKYDEGWDPKLQDVVVCLPGGTRLVFWRGGSYAPFWAGQFNTGLWYEWAEREPPTWGEPLFDWELRYGRVEIIESTPARIHVRWRYRPCNEQYTPVASDSIVEDFYFYPDGFGTRALTLTCEQMARYELNEFIVLRPQHAYPLEVLSSKPIDMLWIDGGKEEFEYPCIGQRWTEFHDMALKKGKPPIFRVRINKSERMTPIQYSPWAIGPTEPYTPHWDTAGGLVTDSPERGSQVTPVWSCNWGPFARGGGMFEISPGTSCLATTGFTAGPGKGDVAPKPIRSEMRWMLDASGQQKPMRRETYTWLIGMTDAGDDQLRQWAQCFARPPMLEAQGAKLDANSYYAPDRRALCLTVEGDKKKVEIKIVPAGSCVNPVLELRGAPKVLAGVSLGGQALDATQYAWDGHTLWIRATFAQPTTLALDFGG